ncbi:hypothetical protein BGZ93_007812 [Podila epicladia]|nr:hypothetical protein BGZ93_007812 [Podila epicladia]
MLAYEAKQRQEQHEAELVQKRLEEEERWVQEQEEARIKEEEARLEKLRITKLAKIQTQNRLKQQEDVSVYVFRNAWDPPNMALNKKKLRIEDDEIELALPLRQDRHSRDMTFSSGAGASGKSDKTEIYDARHVGSKVQGRINTEESKSRVAHETESSKRGMGAGATAAVTAGSMALVNLERSGAVQSSESSSATTTKITTPGSHRFVRTTVTTTIIRRKFKNGVEVSSESSTSSTGGETMFEIPAGERTLPYFTGGRRTVSVTNTQEASRLGSGSTKTTTTTGATRSITGQTTESSRSSDVTQSARSTETHVTGKVSSNVRLVGSATDATTTTKTATKKNGQVIANESTTSESTQFGTTFSTQGGKKLMGLALQIDTTPVLDREIDEAEDLLERQRRNDIREKEASAQAAAEAMQVLSKYPQATSRYARHTTSSTSSSGSSKMATAGLYAADPNLPRQVRTVSEGKGLKVKSVYAESSGDEEYPHMLNQEEDYDELEYFGEKHTRATLPLGSPYMPSTPIVPSSHRYGTSASGFSSRAGSGPTTPGPSTPSRFGSSTPKGFVSKRGFELKQSAVGSLTVAAKETQRDTGFSNYRIEWNWKELLGKKPRHWTAEKGQEHYDPYNALSTHGSSIDSDEDDGRMLESSDEDSEEEELLLLQRSRTTSGGSAVSSKPQTPSFATSEENEFSRESDFVIRGGKIARRRSSMALDRQEL